MEVIDDGVATAYLLRVYQVKPMPCPTSFNCARADRFFTATRNRPTRFPHAKIRERTPAGFKPDSARWEASRLTTTPPWPLYCGWHSPAGGAQEERDATLVKRMTRGRLAAPRDSICSAAASPGKLAGIWKIRIFVATPAGANIWISYAKKSSHVVSSALLGVAVSFVSYLEWVVLNLGRHPLIPDHLPGGVQSARQRRLLQLTSRLTRHEPQSGCNSASLASSHIVTEALARTTIHPCSNRGAVSPDHPSTNLCRPGQQFPLHSQNSRFHHNCEWARNTQDLLRLAGFQPLLTRFRPQQTGQLRENLRRRLHIVPCSQSSFHHTCGFYTGVYDTIVSAIYLGSTIESSADQRHRPARFPLRAPPPGIEPGSPRWMRFSVSNTPPWPHNPHEQLRLHDVGGNSQRSRRPLEQAGGARTLARAVVAHPSVVGCNGPHPAGLAWQPARGIIVLTMSPPPQPRAAQTSRNNPPIDLTSERRCLAGGHRTRRGRHTARPVMPDTYQNCGFLYQIFSLGTRCQDFSHSAGRRKTLDVAEAGADRVRGRRRMLCWRLADAACDHVRRRAETEESVLASRRRRRCVLEYPPLTESAGAWPDAGRRDSPRMRRDVTPPRWEGPARSPLLIMPASRRARRGGKMRGGADPAPGAASHVKLLRTQTCNPYRRSFYEIHRPACAYNLVGEVKSQLTETVHSQVSLLRDDEAANLQQLTSEVNTVHKVVTETREEIILLGAHNERKGEIQLKSSLPGRVAGAGRCLERRGFGARRASKAD
ncbi:hypothetical protein PR048_006986 [Dryococelus australis]|uniref:t-SNARE coiled-coil homology domain-containing protein n=1 Tax=Dryococelus australis TaxID=614101 RepID=A0ABQ9ICH9_9NEOP|nr:hypothetical protein PR048_006986 [Dryococelus australis]